MIVRTGRTGSLDRYAAVLVVLQIEAVIEARIDVFEVGVGSHAQPAIVAACGLRNVGAARVGVLSHAIGVLIDKGNGIVVAAGVESAAQLDPCAAASKVNCCSQTAAAE